MKKFLSILLATMMVLAMVGTAFAAENKTITITATETGHTYRAYQIFEGTPSADGKSLNGIKAGTGVSFTYPITLTVGGVETSIKNITELVAALADENVQEFMRLVNDNLTSVYTASTPTGDGTTYEISVTPGYYFIKDETVTGNITYTDFMVYIVGDVNATPKGEIPTSYKKVAENTKEVTDGDDGTAGNGKYNDTADYNIGDDVPFAIYSKVPAMGSYDTYKMKFVDTMDNSLDLLKDTITLTIGGNVINASYYTVTDSAHGFELLINDLKTIPGVAEGNEVRVDFKATLNSSATIGLSGNVNKSQMFYSNNPSVSGEGDAPNGETPEDYVVVFTYKLDVTKKDGNTTTSLANAKFKFYRVNGGTNEYVVVGTDNTVTDWVTDIAQATEFVTVDDGLIQIIGLDHGEYYLVETEAPEGFTTLSSPVPVVITATTQNNNKGTEFTNTNATQMLTALSVTVDGVSANGDLDEGLVTGDVLNYSGATLPETGGIGTTLFYLFGSLMTVGSALMLVVRRRAEAEEE